MNNIVKSFSLAMIVSSTALAMEEPTLPKSQPLKPSLSHILAINQPWVARFTPNGEKLVGGSADAKLIIWNTDDLSQSKSVPVGEGVFCLDVHPDNKHIVIHDGSPERISFWDLESGKRVGNIPEWLPSVNSLQYNAHGSELLVATDKVCQIWDLNSDKLKQSLPTNGIIWDAKWNPVDNNYIAASHDGGIITPEKKDKISVWDLRKNQPVYHIQADISVDKIRYNTNGSRLVGAALGQLVAYNAQTAALISYYNLKGKRVKQPTTNLHVLADAIECMPENDTTFVVGLSDKKLLFCDTEDDSKSFSFDAVEGSDSDDIDALAIHPNGKSMASGLFFGNCIQLWDIAAIKEEFKKCAETKGAKTVTRYTGRAAIK